MTFCSQVDGGISPSHKDTCATLSLEIVPSPETAHNARLAIARFISHHVPTSDASIEFMLAVGEALANAVEHGVSSSEIQIRVEIRDSKASVVIIDHGQGFQPQISFKAALPDAESERGRGLPIIFYCTDSFTIDSHPEAGTRVSLCRELR